MGRTWPSGAPPSLSGFPARLVQRVPGVLGEGVQLGTEEVPALVEELERRRPGVLRAHEGLRRPTRVPVSSVALGSRPDRGPGADRLLQTWRAGARRLTTACPEVELTWPDSDQPVPLRCPDEVADLVDATAARTREP